MRKINRFFLCFLCILVFTLTAEAKHPKVKNIIFLIGDGMGLNQMYAGMTYNKNSLQLERCTHIGLVKTYSANKYVTDSGAGGTALACGVKTNNKMIGMGPDSVAVESILHLAEKNGLSTGVVVACNVTHATPASFVAHQVSRKMTQEIAVDYLKTDIDVFIGGGRDDFEKRKDNRNLSQELKLKDYRVVYTMDELTKVKSGKVAALLADNHPERASKRGDMLPDATQKAIELLSKNKKGFFLMIEGSQIDWAAHDNDIDYLIEELLDFDKAIGIALDFAAKNKETLVVITADHETGGLSILKGDFSNGKVKASFASNDHSGVPVPVYAYGTGAELFVGFMENTSFKEKFARLYQFKEGKMK